MSYKPPMTVDSSARDDGAHVGTTDLDVALEVSVLGDQLERGVAFCGPAAFVALKAFAFSKRTERKDAYDLVYVLHRWPHGLTDIADRMATHARRDPDLVSEILELLERDFGTKASSGPRSASRFYDGRVDDTRVMDAHGAVDDFLQACAQRGVEWQRPD